MSVVTGQEGTAQHRAGAGQEQEKDWAPQGRAGQDGGGQPGEADGAVQHSKKQCMAGQGRSRCVCVLVRSGTLAKLVCFEFASVAGGVAFPSLLWVVMCPPFLLWECAAFPPAVGWHCSFPSSLIAAFSSLLSVVVPFPKIVLTNAIQLHEYNEIRSNYIKLNSGLLLGCLASSSFWMCCLPPPPWGGVVSVPAPTLVGGAAFLLLLLLLQWLVLFPCSCGAVLLSVLRLSAGTAPSLPSWSRFSLSPSPWGWYRSVASALDFSFRSVCFPILFSCV